ncbi:uncharacterized protein MYCFIDRAFT_78705 [Pseudocercospora fijiensis CIRAD86]|uniref:Proteophosphoglycan 5 n=1 Tax=Pseudocercospora fijiensis (strain CIRAD86) TaxID=383855 RepID=M3AWM9_PSEFD|nr:uncharacterized protein MYCFIDRAFT_78705 [Pseudocercospora fijiensis CIRAD86]EME81867.1 hypothetical protein MYCFIDRAFT_78705 [Pseudocercospora fijiensis CIRAD86]
MTEFASDAPIASAAQSNNQRTPSAAEGKRRSNRNRNRNQVDGAMSDGALVNSTSSPQKTHRQRRSVAIAAAGQQKSLQQNPYMGNGNSAKQRPVSYAGNQMLATPAKERAYAGPTFQASPAASALPMPKFSRSVPNGGRPSSLSAKLAGEKTPEAEQSSPEADIVKPTAPPDEGHKSPLDLFFQADKAEREQARALSQPSLSPEFAKRPATMPRNPFQQSGRSIFLSELDGDNAMPSPRTVPPNTSRPPYAERAISSPGIPARHQEFDQERRDSTKALKDMLFQTANGSNTSTPQNQSRTNSGQHTPDGVFGSPSPGLQPSCGPSTPRPASEQQQQQNHYSLHYGNRNLSPLFKAARSDSSTRPTSGLRQEVPSDTSSNADSVVAVGDPNSPNTFARNYLNQTARTAGPAELPPFPYNNHSASFNTPAMQRGGTEQNADAGSQLSAPRALLLEEV